jgi:hypothetical protein
MARAASQLATPPPIRRYFTCLTLIDFPWTYLYNGYLHGYVQNWGQLLERDDKSQNSAPRVLSATRRLTRRRGGL